MTHFVAKRSPRRISAPRRLFRPLVAAAFCMLAAAGCRDPRRAPHPTAASAPAAVDTADPAAVARAYLDCCRTLARVGIEGMRDVSARDAFKAAEATIMLLSDRDGIRERFEPGWGRVRNERIREERIDSVVKNWPSILANYVDGADYGTMRVSAPARGDAVRGVSPLAEQVAILTAVNHRQQALIDRARAELADQKDVRGRPLREDPAEYARALRWRAVQLGAAPSPAATLLIGLRRTGDGWRVTSVAAAPADAPAASTAGAANAARSPAG